MRTIFSLKTIFQTKKKKQRQQQVSKIYNDIKVDKNEWNKKKNM